MTLEVHLSLQKLNLPTEIYDVVIKCDNEHHSTKFHRESLLTHLNACGKMCEEICHIFDIPLEIAYWVGFLHDIGKPLARRPFLNKDNTIKRVNFIGHAQLGTCLAQHILNTFSPNLIPPQYHNALLYCIDNHMCCVGKDKGCNKKFHSMLHMTLTEDKEQTIRMVCMLFAADNLSRICDESIDKDACISQSLTLMQTLLSTVSQPHIPRVCSFRQSANDKIILLLLGLSGSGKSTFCNHAKQLFANTNINIAHVERDNSLFYVANTLTDKKELKYKEAYDLVASHEAKPLVQKHWVDSLTNALEDTSNNLILIDTMQSMFYAWQKTLDALSEEAKSTYYNSFKVGLYFIPIHQLGYDVKSKTEMFMTMPNSEMFMPNINLELGSIHTNHLDVGSGWQENTLRWIKTFLGEKVIPSVPQQKTLCELVVEQGSLNEMMKGFPEGLLEIQTEFEDSDIRIVTVSYMDGRQIFVGPSRDYRGETLLYLKKENRWRCLRGSLPVFPDFSGIEKDPGVFPYILDCVEQTSIPNHWVKDLEATPAKYVMTYKYDGSLFNMVFLPKECELYEIINKLIVYEKVEWVYSRLLSGLLVYGSKGRFGLHTGNPVKSRGRAAILGSYGSMEVFEKIVETFLGVEGLRDKTVTLHFEAIDKVPTSELTVYYGRAFCPFFGYTEFTDMYKRFHLVGDHVWCPFTCRTPTIVKESWKEVLEEFTRQRDGLMSGDKELEPEGCVVHIFGFREKNEWFPVKLKHDFYYVAHKPTNEKNKVAAKELLEDVRYEKLRERLAKCRAKPSIESLLGKITEDRWEIFSVEFKERRDMAIYWNHPAQKEKTDVLQKDCESILKEHYGVVKVKIWKWMMEAFPAKFTREICCEKIKLDL
jgi:hypothetical protein